MKKLILTTVATLGLLAATSQAAVITYPSMDVNYSTPGGTAVELTTGLINIDAAHAFTGNNTVYYAGTITMTGNITTWHSFANVNFFTSGNGSVMQVGVGVGHDKIVFHKEAWNDTATPTPNVTTGTFNYQIKIAPTGDPANPNISLFWGANAIAATEGTADHLWNSSSIGNSVGRMSVTFSATEFASAFSFSTTNIASDTAWIAPIPEPTTWALLAGGLTTLMVIRHRRKA